MTPAEQLRAAKALIDTMAEALQIASLELRDIASGLQPPSGAVAAGYIESALDAYSAFAEQPA